MKHRRLIWIALLACSVRPARGGEARSIQASFATDSTTIAAQASSVPIGGAFRLHDVPLGGATGETLILERFEVFSPDLRVVVHEGDREVPGAPPKRIYLRGEILGDPASLAFVSIDERGDLRGIVSRAGRTRLLGDRPDGMRGLAAQEVASDGADPQRTFTCNAAELEPLPSADPRALFSAAEVESAVASAITPLYTARVAIETDYEFLQLFGGNVDAAAGYVGDLLGAISAIYYRDVGTTLQVNYLSFWSTTADPWSGTSTAGLCEFGTWWHNNRPPSSYPRATAQFLSGKNVGSGIAWLGVLCASDFAATGTCAAGQYGGGYSFIAGLRGVFSLSNPSFFWDLAGTAHELGHNFSSPHTHCYNNVPSAGAASPVDQCRNSTLSNPDESFNGAVCYSGAQSVPAGGGSLMSYCHLLSPGYSNVNLAFGQAGLYGTQSERVTARMRSHVTSRSCLAFAPGRPADFNQDGRSDVTIYRNGAWITFPEWPGD